MTSVKQLLSEALALLRAHPVLLIPPFVADALIAMLAPGRGGLGGLVLATMIQLAITAGWLTMIAKLRAGEKSTWDDFFTSVGRHFWSMVGGAVNQLLASLALAVPLLLVASVWIGETAVKRLESELKPFLEGKADPATLSGALSPEAMQAASQLAMLGMLWLLAFALLSFVLLFWQQGVVLRHQGWLQAWRESASLVRAHLKGALGLVTVLGLAQGLAVVLGLLAPFAGAFVAALAAVTLLLARVYASVATTLYYMELVKTHAETLPSPPAPQG